MRPTSDRLRETLFNVIAPRIQGARFLDLCAGSGAVGIEALSRDAAHVTFVEQTVPMFALIRSNLQLCHIEANEATVIRAEAEDYLKRTGGSSNAEWHPWDIAFFDPPYAMDHSSILAIFGAQTSHLLSNQGLLIVEHHHKTALPARYGKLNCGRVLKQGDSALSFYEPAGPE